ncbi:hypothetical protein ACFMQL_36605 [Nonomuraea fastidiosa]|uniref:hypothetical protein n=2 Tax=Nonomuraea TaxID=83681 RepID=UPI00366E34DF
MSAVVQLLPMPGSPLTNRRHLVGAQGSVPEGNVSAEIVARYKRASLQRLETVAAPVGEHLPERGGNAAPSGCSWACPPRSRTPIMPPLR